MVATTIIIVYRLDRNADCPTVLAIRHFAGFKKPVNNAIANTKNTSHLRYSQVVKVYSIIIHRAILS